VNWHDRREVKKGDYAEELVCRHFQARGHVPYRPHADRAHKVDLLFLTQDCNIFAVDVKAKAARTYYPDTGIDISSYRTYEDLVAKRNISVFLSFVDEHKKEAYGNDLLALTQPQKIAHNGKVLEYPLRHRGIIYFPLVAMVHMFDLTDKDCAALIAESHRSYEYPDYSYEAASF
jgi:hypothetical protein